MNGPFNDISLSGLLKVRCFKIPETPYHRIFFALSQDAPDEWCYTFDETWKKTVFYMKKRNAGAEGDAIWIECPMEEVEKDHFGHLQKAVAETNKHYRDGLERQMRAAHDEATRNQQARRNLDDLEGGLFG